MRLAMAARSGFVFLHVRAVQAFATLPFSSFPKRSHSSTHPTSGILHRQKKSREPRLQPWLWFDSLRSIRGGSSGSSHVLANSSPNPFAASSVEHDEDLMSPAALAAALVGTSTFNSNSSKVYSSTMSSQQSNPIRHRVLFVLGGPGAGKGTQCAKIVEMYKSCVVHLSVGELLRNERANETSLDGALIEEYLVAGKIVPVEISLRLLRRAMDDNEGKICLVDGFPRNFDNLRGWTRIMSSSASVLGALVYDCPVVELERRIMNRAISSGRSDDNFKSAKKRFDTFQRDTMPVVRALEHAQSYLRQQQQTNLEKNGNGRMTVSHIQGDQHVDNVWKDTEKVMNEFIASDVWNANARLLGAIEANDLDTYMSLCLETMTIAEKGEGTKKEELARIFDAYERFGNDTTSNGIPSSTSRCDLYNKKVTIHDGTKAVVTYDRHMDYGEKEDDGTMKGSTLSFQETRVWSHDTRKKGWICIHFVRRPLSSMPST